jgi:hypothetical protein
MSGVEGPAFSSRISKASRQELVALVSGSLHLFTERDVLHALRHLHVSEPVIGVVLASRTIMALRSVRKAVALHPATPRHAALRCLDDLTWRDLLDVGRETRTPPPVRRLANLKLLDALRRLSGGEKIALARLAGRDLLADLLDQEDPRITQALLNNPRLTSEDLVRWLTVGSPDGDRLALLAGDPRWNQRPPVRQALLRHPLTPMGAALSLLTSASREELRLLTEDPRAHPLLAACARRLCENVAQTVDRRRK